MEATRSRPKTPRASVACTTCRCRKVRCDVSRRGHPCMNCELDHEECVVLPRSRRKRPEKSPAMPDVVDGTTPSMPVSSAGNDSATQEINTDTHAVDIPFQAYGFIKADFLARLPQDEICYLDSQCCFRLPVRGSWNRLIHAYFRHINPLLPVVDEANFWEQPLGDGPATMSLFVAQAILFAACPFADCQAIEGCGFANCREARAAFYRRAKLLYRLESERNPVSIIKGSLLLSLCSSPQIQNPVNSIWLGIAIQYARSMGAHYLSPQGSSPSFEWRRLKRLWWSCLLRDRLIALGYQRPLQIPEADLEADLAIITSEEISHDICWSKVHSLPIRRELLFVFRAFCRLCIPLTRMLKLIATPRCSADSLKEADDCARSLKSWLDFTNGHLEASDVELRGNDLVILHYHLVQIYFHAAYLNILNFKIVMLGSTQTERDEHKSSLLPTASAVQASVEATADSLYMLERQGLVGLLPIAAARCIVLPFVLHSMHIKLSPTTDVTDAPQKRTESFLQLIRSLQVRQNNVNTLENVIEQVLTFIQPRQPMADWKQLILSQPGSYLRVLKTLELALSTGIFPSKSEAPLTMTGADSDGKENLSRPDADGEGQSGPVPVPEKVQFVPETEYNLLDDNDGIFESLWRVEEELFGIAENSSDVDSGHPILRDIFGVCRDQDFEALLNMI